MEFRPNMTEQELLTDLLNEEKHLVTQYASNITESACMNLRQLLMTNMSECSSDHYSVFDQMRKRNMYKTKQAQQQEVDTAKQDMQNLKNQTGI